MKVLLASKSPRRRELLKKIIPDFDVCAVDAPENLDENEQDPERAVLDVALRKMDALGEVFGYSAVITADTTVFLDGKYYGKPKDRCEAVRILTELSGRTHKVITGVAVACGDKAVCFSAVTDVTFKKLTAEEIDGYCDNYNVYDKAGAYAVQDGVVVESYSGDYDNIVGLPVKELEKVLKEDF